MTKEELKTAIDSLYDCNGHLKTNGILRKQVNEELSNIYPDIESFSEKIYLFQGNEKHLCLICGKKTVFMDANTGYQEHCGSVCAGLNKDVQKKREKTNLKTYGYKNGFQSPKTKETLLKKYGTDHPMHSNIIKEKVKQTNIEKYGVESPLQSKNILNKMKQTNLEKYGVENISQINGFSQKVKNTKLKKYDDENYNNKEKMRQTNLEKYGVENAYQSKEIKEKIKQTNLEKYGEENPGKFNGSFFKEGMLKKYVVEHSSMSYQTIKKRKNTFKNTIFEKIISSNKLIHIVKPLFSLEDYKNTDYRNKYLWKCLKCNTNFQDDLYSGNIPRCPICFPQIPTLFSKSEKEIVDFVKSLGEIMDENSRKIISPFELDIYIASHNLAIEFDGIYWHSELNGKDKCYHLNKTEKCNKLKIHLLHVFEDEWIEKQDIVKSIICSKLGIYQQIVGARKCQLKEINYKEASMFYDMNHLQGSSNSKINIGLFHKDELVSCLSLSKPRFNKKYDWEITRFSNKLNTKIVGSFIKLFKYFLSNYEGSIITYSDRRYFDGSIYKRNGFTELKDSSPSYYYTDYKHRYNRVEFQKHKLKDKLKDFDPNLTEWENMQLNGWDRIWDCGNKVFVYITPDG